MYVEGKGDPYPKTRSKKSEMEEAPRYKLLTLFTLLTLLILLKLLTHLLSFWENGYYAFICMALYDMALKLYGLYEEFVSWTVNGMEWDGTGLMVHTPFTLLRLLERLGC